MRVSQFAVFTDYQRSTLAFNTLTHELIRIEMNYDDFQHALGSGSLPLDVYDTLRQGRYLVDKNHDEFSNFLIDYRQKRYGPQYLVMYITPTLRCNAGCYYCFQRDIRTSLSRQTGPDPERLLIFVASKLHDALGLKVTWFGGEPLLKKDYIESVSVRLMRLASLTDKPYHASMVTNGLLLSDKVIQCLQRSRISNLQISLDGNEETHNAAGRRDAKRGFQDIINNISRVPESIRIALRINVSAANIGTLVVLLDLLAEAGLTKRNISLDFPLIYNFTIGGTHTPYEACNGYLAPNMQYGLVQLRLLAYARHIGFHISIEDILVPGSSQCHAIRSKGYSVWPDGSVTRCIHEVSTPERFSIDTTYLDMIHVTSQQKYLTAEVFEHDLCRSCYFVPICGGGCLHGRFHGLEPLAACPPAKYTLQYRMQWYEAEKSGSPCPVDTNRVSLVQELCNFANSISSG